MSQEHLAGRGDPWDHDPGPPAKRRWARLFAQTPNYRGLGTAVLGREGFRWHFGPMFYRGRLRDGEARVLVIGQEGAQDESLAHRSIQARSRSPDHPMYLKVNGLYRELAQKYGVLR